MHNIETDISFSREDDPEELMNSVQSMTRSSLYGVLGKTRMTVDFGTIVEEVSQQVLIEIFGKELGSLVEVRTRIKSLCFEEVNHAIHYRTGKSDSYDEGLFESFGEDPRALEDESDSSEMKLTSRDLLADRKLDEEEQRGDRLYKYYEYFIQELYGLYMGLEDEFLKELFLRRFVEGKDRACVGHMIRNKRLPRSGIHPGSVERCEKVIFQRVSDLTGVSLDKVGVLLAQARTAVDQFMKVSEEEGDLVDLFSKVGNRSDGFHGFENLKLDEISISSESPVNPIKVPGLLTDRQAEGLRTEAITRLQDQLDLFLQDPASFSQRKPQQLFPHQYEKLQGIIECLERQLVADNEKFMIADIAPPSAGKTYMQAVLAKLSGLPFVFVTPSNTILEGADSAMSTFQKLFPMQELGIVNGRRKEFGRKGTLTTYKSFSQQENLCNILMRPSGEIPPFLFLMDEGDLSQTEMRKQVLEAVRRSLKHPLICAFSATTKVAGKDLADMADIVDEMGLKELVEIGKAKHILGLFVDGQLTVTAKKVQKHNDDKEVLFSKLKGEEREAFTEIPVELVLENHREAQGIIHCMSVDHAQKVADRLKEEGINTRCISGTEFGERARLKEQYVGGELQVLTSCEVLGRGFSDYGATTFIVFAAVTSSITSLYQKIGRGLRPHPTNKLLTIYQLMPAEIQSRTFLPATLYDIFDPADFPEELNDPKGESSVRDYMTRIIELIENKQLEFTGIVGQPIDPKGRMSFFDRKRVEEIIDTRKEWPSQSEVFTLTEDNIDERFTPILEKFMEAGQITDYSALNTNTPNSQMTIIMDGKSIRWRSFILGVIRTLTGMRKAERIKHHSLGIGLIKEWGDTGVRPSSEFIRERVKMARGYRKEKDKVADFELTAENIDEYFLPIANLFVEKFGEEFGAKAFRKGRVLVNGKSITGETFARRVFSIFVGIGTQEALGFWSLSTDLVREWYTERGRPGSDSVRVRFEEEKRKRAEKPPKLKLTPGNIDGLLRPLVDCFIEKLGEKEDCSCIVTGDLDRTCINLDGRTFTGRAFVTNVLGILVGIKGNERLKYLSLGAELIRKWYEDDERPSEDFVVKRFSEHEEARHRRASDLIDDEFLDENFATLVDRFVKECGVAGYERLSSSNQYNKVSIVIGNVNVRWTYFILKTTSLLTGLGVSESSYNKALGMILVREWYRTGKRPEERFIQELIEKSQEPKAEGSKRRSRVRL